MVTPISNNDNTNCVKQRPWIQVHVGYHHSVEFFFCHTLSACCFRSFSNSNFSFNHSNSLELDQIQLQNECALDLNQLQSLFRTTMYKMTMRKNDATVWERLNQNPPLSSRWQTVTVSDKLENKVEHLAGKEPHISSIIGWVETKNRVKRESVLYSYDSVMIQCSCWMCKTAVKHTGPTYLMILLCLSYVLCCFASIFNNRLDIVLSFFSGPTGKIGSPN